MDAPTYSCSTESLGPGVHLLRVHEGPGGRYGDPFVWACTVVGDGEVATLKGAVAAPPWSAVGPIHAALRAAGYTRRRHERIRAGKVRVVEVDLNTKE